MSQGSRPPLRITWLAPDDRGGGVVSVAEACCRQASIAGHEATLLLALAPSGHAAEFGGFKVSTLDSAPPHVDIPIRLIEWLKQHPQDLVLTNGCEQADAALPYVPGTTRLIYVVHDTAERYYSEALRNESQLDAIIAVSGTVADRFRHLLREPAKLHVVHNGTVLPNDPGRPSSERSDDLVFLGGDAPAKGAYDAIKLWRVLARRGYKGRLHWFGKIDESIGRALQGCPARDRIVLHGRKPRAAIFGAAGQSKVFLMLSRGESFGMATIECMGMGCLPVAWDVPIGTKEIVGEGEAAFAPLGDFEALADGVLRLIEDHPKRHEAAAVRVRAAFGEEVMWSRYAAVIEELLRLPPVIRPRAGRVPPPYRRPLRLYQLLPSRLRMAIRSIAGRWPRLGYAFRDFRGR